MTINNTYTFNFDDPDKSVVAFFRNALWQLIRDNRVPLNAFFGQRVWYRFLEEASPDIIWPDLQNGLPFDNVKWRSSGVEIECNPAFKENTIVINCAQ